MYGIKLGQEIYGKLGGWTADSWIMADVSADIPGKIDMRWMSRYGIFIYMSKKFEEAGVKFESYAPMVQAVPKLLEAQAKTPIQVDLKWFSKLIQATGLHPAWVPIVTVAENIMAISDEMTLLRTGWLNLFKEGLLDLDKVEKGLAGLITVSYQVGYWDPEAKTWKSGWINLPVRWLPHERKLLQLRMSMDRILDVYREFYRFVSSGVRTLAISHDEAMEKLKHVTKLLNEHYKVLTKSITGKEMTIEFDEAYVDLWLKVMEQAQLIEVKERIRYWWLRVSGWLLYRIAYGYVTSQDIENLASKVAKIVPLHKEEVEAFKELANALIGIVSREYVPTPLTLASISEYMVVPEDIIEYSFKQRRIPKKLEPFWRKYIAIRPYVDDVRYVLGRYLYAKRKGAEIPKDFENQLKKLFQAYGIEEKEIEIRDIGVLLDLMVEAIPTLGTLASMAEYIDVPEEFVKQVLEKRRVTGTYAELWIKYVGARTISSEVNQVVSEYRRIYEYFFVTPETTKKVKELMLIGGWTKREMPIFELALELRKAYRVMTYMIPTIRQAVADAYYIPEWERLFNDLLKARGVDVEKYKKQVEYYKKLIRNRLVWRQIAWYRNRLIYAYANGVITKDQLRQKLQKLKNYGLSDAEIELILDGADLEKQTTIKIYGPR